MVIDEADLGRFTEQVLIALTQFTDRDGCKIMLSADDRITVLAAAITAVNNGRDDLRMFRPIRIGPGGQIEFVE